MKNAFKALALILAAILALSAFASCGNKTATSSDTTAPASSDTKDGSAASSGDNNIELQPSVPNDNADYGEPVDVEDCFAVSTAYCNLYISKDYEGKITAVDNGFSVDFSGVVGEQSYPIFTVLFASSEGEQMGFINDGRGNKTSVSFKYYENYNEFYQGFTDQEKDEYDAMLEQINVLYNQLTKLENYSAK